jgi:hypothetical protein
MSPKLDYFMCSFSCPPSSSLGGSARDVPESELLEEFIIGGVDMTYTGLYSVYDSTLI